MGILGSILGFLGSYWWVGLILLALAFWKAILWLFGAIIADQNEIIVVSLKFRLFGKNKALPDGKIIAVNGEAGWQAKTLGPGLHIGYFPWQYKTIRQPFITIPQGKVGVVEAKDGVPIPVGHVLGKQVECDAFQDAEAFLKNGGQRGPQVAIITPGTYRINTAIFKVDIQDAIMIPQNKVGIVTTREGTPLATGEIAGSETKDHNMYQDAQKFVNNSGSKGLQEQVMLAGLYYLNPLFAKVELIDMTEVPIGHVGVVIAFVGERGADVTGEGFGHGNIVEKNKKGVWNTPLDPGKYPINTFTHKIELVPTTNIVLNWANNKSEAHNLDKELCTITVRSKDGFTFNLDVAQIIHVPYTSAPKVIARFGNMGNLVTQVLEPTIGNYFRNSAQSSDVIDFLSGRKERQNEAKEAISGVLNGYDVIAVDTLIGDINPPEALMKTLTDRKIADQEKTTYGTQKQAQDARQELAESTALADTMGKVVDSKRKIEISKNEADAKIQAARGDAESKTINAEADKKVLVLDGEGQSSKTLAIGNAEAEVLQKKTAAVGQQGYVAMNIAEQLGVNHTQLVPQFLVNAGGDGKSGSIADAFIGFMMAQKANGEKSPVTLLTASNEAKPAEEPEA